MANQSIGLGSAADDGTGDNLRVAFDKVNDNFVEIYTHVSPGDGGFFKNKDTVSASQTVDTGSGVNSAVFGDLTIANGAIFTIANNSNLRVI